MGIYLLLNSQNKFHISSFLPSLSSLFTFYVYFAFPILPFLCGFSPKYSERVGALLASQ